MKRAVSCLFGALIGLASPSAHAQSPAASAATAPSPAAAASAAVKPASSAPAPQPHGSPAAATSDAAPLAVPAPPNPHGAGQQLVRDESSTASDLPKGSIEGVMLTPDGAPIPNVDVRIGIMFQRISEGESRSERTQRTNAEGRARFDGLNTGSDYSYRVTLKSGAAEYASMPFQLGDVGHRVVLHVFPVTSDISQALIGMRSFLYIEPRDDVFVFEVLYRIFNLGNVTWVPKDLVLALPKGYKAFAGQRGMSDVTFEEAQGEGARLKGTFTPGQHDVSFRFQLPKSADSTEIFRISTLPRVAELRVIAEASSQMHLDVEGFEPVQVAANQQGKRVLVTRKLLEHGNELEQGFTVTLSGLPVPGYGRWVAVGLAVALAALGFGAAQGRVDLGGAGSKARDLKRARDVLLQELVEVERSREQGDLGPTAYADARRVLLNALARLGRDALEAPTPRKKPRRATA